MTQAEARRTTGTIDGARVDKEISMNEGFSFGGLIPLWILGAGWVWGLVESFRTPTPTHRSDRSTTYADATARPVPVRRAT